MSDEALAKEIAGSALEALWRLSGDTPMEAPSTWDEEMATITPVIAAVLARVQVDCGGDYCQRPDLVAARAQDAERIRELTQQRDGAEDAYSKVLARNAALERENAALRGRVEELTKIAEKFVAAHVAAGAPYDPQAIWVSNAAWDFAGALDRNKAHDALNLAHALTPPAADASREEAR